MDKTNIAFDQFQRYETICRLVEFHRRREGQSFRVLELGSNEHKDLRLFLPQDEIMFTDIALSEAMEKDPDFQRVDGTAIPFDDKSFDFVVAADVLEHVPAEKREKFLREAWRVSRLGVILSFPFYAQDVMDAEARVNEYYKTLAGEDFIWLKEHLENSLPKTEEIGACLNKLGIPFFSLFHGDIRVWEKMWYCVFSSLFEPETLPFHTYIDNYYNRNIYARDVSDSCYRVFCVMAHEGVEDWEKCALGLWEKGRDTGDAVRFLEDLIRTRQELHALSEKNRLNEVIVDKERHIQNQNRIIEDKERHIQNQTQIIEAKDSQLQARTEALEKSEAELTDCESKLADCESELATLREKGAETAAELTHYQEHYAAAMAQRNDLERQLAQVNAAYQSISNATLWKMTKPLRVVLDAIKRPLRRIKLLRLVHGGFKCLREHGLRYTWGRFCEKCRRHWGKPEASKPLHTKKELEAQRAYAFPRPVKISIVVPLYNTPQKFLEEMIRSVQDQTYSNWELCLADGSDKEHAYVASVCKRYAKKDQRIRYQKLAENKGISENTNACIAMVTGDYIGLLDHDDLLHPSALYHVMEAICEKDADFIYTDENTFHETPEDAYCPHFKPDFAPDTLRSYNYICHFTVFRRTLLDALGTAFRPEFDGSQDYDLILRLTEKAKQIVHIPKILYYWRAHEASTASDVSAKPYTLAAARSALQEHLRRVGLDGQVGDARIPSTYRIRYKIQGKPLISILIPNKDHVDDLKKCIDSIREKSTYSKWEIIIIENNSEERATFAYYDTLKADKRIRVVYWKGTFNYAAIVNYGAGYATGKHLLLLNNDIEVITPDWLEQMLMYSQREDVGAVGAMLYYPDDTVQHAGVILGIGGVGGHAHKYFPRGDHGYMSRMAITQNYSAVTAACLMMRREVWNEVGGLDEDFAVAFNDVDLCMKIRKAGYLIVWTPYAELYHYESKTRGLEDTPEKQARFSGEVKRFLDRWDKELVAGDPYYNPNLTLDREDFSPR